MDDGVYNLAGAFFSLIVGLSLGSFATMLTWRLPRDLPVAFSSRTKKDAHPDSAASDGGDHGGVERSRCPSCQAQLGLPDLVPLFSWLFLKGQCRHCGAAIPAVYPLVETGTALICLAAFFAYGWCPQLFVIWALAPVLSAIVAIDQQHQIIPNGLNAAVILLGALYIVALGWQEHAGRVQYEALLTDAAMGAVFFGATAWVIRFIFTRVFRREAMGLGDVKFFAAAGVWLGPLSLPWFMALSGLTGTLLGVLALLRHGRSEIPFGPALVFSFILMLLMPDWFQLSLADY